MAEQKKFRPVGYNPQGWPFRPVFIDDEGNVFEKGKHNPELKNTYDWKSRQKDEEKANGKAAGKQETPEQQINPFETNGVTVTPEMLQAMVDHSKEQDKMIKQLQESMKKTPAGAIDSNSGVMIDNMAQAIAKSQQHQAGGEYYLDPKNIDPEDYDEKGAMFTSYGNGYLIIDDKRNGHAVRTPYGNKFKFRFQGAHITRVGRVDSYSSFCSFRTNSKREIEWLRSHSRYGIEFYENTNLAISMDARKIDIAARIHKQVQNLERDQILARAKKHNIPIGGDLDGIASMLSLTMATEEMKRLDQEQLNRTKGSFEGKFV